MKHSTQKGFAAVWATIVVIAAIIAIIVAATKAAHDKSANSSSLNNAASTSLAATSTNAASSTSSSTVTSKPHSTKASPSSRPVNMVTIMVPRDLPGYINAINDYISNGGAQNPALTWTFVPETLMIPPTTDVVGATAEAAAEVVHSQAGTSNLIAYLKVVNGTAYVVLTMDENGWAGVSFAIAKAHPIVEKSLLALPGITAVKFGKAPEDAMRPQSVISLIDNNSDWKTFSGHYGISIKYPPGSVVTDYYTPAYDGSSPEFTIQSTLINSRISGSNKYLAVVVKENDGSCFKFMGSTSSTTNRYMEVNPWSSPAIDSTGNYTLTEQYAFTHRQTTCFQVTIGFVGPTSDLKYDFTADKQELEKIVSTITLPE